MHTHENHSHSHPHTHEVMDGPGEFRLRNIVDDCRDFSQRAFTVGIGGPVGSGKTALLKYLCERLRNDYSLRVITNDIFTKEDAEFLVRNDALETDRILAVETGGCPHAAIRDDVSLNIAACHELMGRFDTLDLLFVESGGDNLAAHFSRELADYTIYVIDVSGGDKIPRKGGPGITQSDLLLINKTDLAEIVGADLGVMDRDAKNMRGDGPYLFTKSNTGDGIEEVIQMLLEARTANLSKGT